MLSQEALELPIGSREFLPELDDPSPRPPIFGSKDGEPDQDKEDPLQYRQEQAGNPKHQEGPTERKLTNTFNEIFA